MKARKIITFLLAHLGMLLATLLVLLPILYALLISTQSPSEYYAFPPKLRFGSDWLENYSIAWQQAKLGRLLLNSSFVAIAVALGKIVLSILAAFAFIYFDFRFKVLFFVLILITHMLPLPVRIVPTFELIDQFRWVNSFNALTIPFFASATGVLLFHQLFRTIPRDLADAAVIDGASPLQFLWSILIPLSFTNMAALFLIEFIYMWNQYLWPLIVANFERTRQIQIGLKLLIATDATIDWHIVMAGVMVALLPPLLLLIALQAQFIRGVAMQQEK